MYKFQKRGCGKQNVKMVNKQDNPDYGIHSVHQDDHPAVPGAK